MKLKVSLAFGLCLFLINSAVCQFNITVGLNSSYALAKENNSILKIFNANNTDISEPFKDLKFVAGLELGLRYGTDNGAITLGYTSSRRKRSATQVDALDMVSNTNLNYTFGTYYLGFELGAERFKIGTNIGRRNVKIKSQVQSATEFETIINQGNWVSKFYLDFGARGNDISRISLRPYFDFAWGKTDLNALNTELTGNQLNVNESFHMIGLSIVFFNGPQ